MASLQAPNLPEAWSDPDSIELDSLSFMNNDDTNTETTESDEAPPVETPAIISSGSSGNPLLASTIIYSIDLPEYPKTSPDGVAYIVNIYGKSNIEIQYQLQNVQYSHARKHPIKTSTSIILDGAHCTREVIRCSGVKACEYLHPQIKSMTHTEVTETMWQTIREFRKESSEDSPQKIANSFFLSIRNSFRKKTSCKGFIDSCHWLMIQLPNTTVSNVPVYIVRCVNHNPASKNHLYKVIPPAHLPEISFLFDRFRNPIIPETETCGVVLQNNAKRPNCGIDHIQGPGQVTHMECKVVFNIFRPDDTTQKPYLIFTSHGTHSHPPPPPTRTPKELMNAILDVITRLNDPTLTLNTLLKNPALREFCQRFNKRSLAEVHQSLANYDKISALIYKQRLLSYPDGQSITGVEFEYIRRHKDNPDGYIQFVYNDGINFVVICFFRQQIELLAQRESIEIDMGFKRLRDSDEKEIVFAGWMPETNKVVTFARIFVNQETTQMYIRVFEFLTKLLKDRFQIDLRWEHLHGSGLKAIIMDQDSKQFAGISKYLSSIDPQHRHWHWQMKNCIVFCLIHFQRGIEKLVGTQGKSSTSLWTRMMELPKCNSKDEYMHLCDLLISSVESPRKVQDWAMNKKHDIIAAGYNKHCSDISNTTFDSLRKHTNAVESTHYKSNSMGRYLSLLRAIEFVEVLDRKDFQQYHAAFNHGITTSYRVRSMSAHYEDIQRRNLAKAERIQRRSETNKRGRLEDIDIENDFPDILSEASSSGVVRARSRRRLTSPSASRLSSRAPSRVSSRAPSRTPNRASLAQQTPLNIDLIRRREEAEVRRLELENEKLELEIRQARRGDAV